VWKFSRDNQAILDAQRLVTSSAAKVALGTDCGVFPFNHGIREFQAMVDAGLTPIRALKAGTSVAAELLGRTELGVLKPGACADIVAMPGNPLDDIAATAQVDFVMRGGDVYRRRPRRAARILRRVDRHGAGARIPARRSARGPKAFGVGQDERQALVAAHRLERAREEMHVGFSRRLLISWGPTRSSADMSG
jgi:cytosine/adenosine deaminase-related metal-dependent hydrolase